MAVIELRAFADLQKIFKQNGWNMPHRFEIPDEGTTGKQLARQLQIPEEKLEAIFINGVVYNLTHPIKPGDRVGLVPPGLPSIYRVHLGFYSKNNRK
ncbi:molybdopterin converting factor small subunit [Desulfohalotomaculum tongense]|uniref:MoaD/ThiS family protein n=1 Tax=Desulforadius tongensis TaxID=1216062 RepID=UPI00195852E8|nr:MoaD/ThiS family protein [Desulforadius tongensis]MBM7853978.1 molybdopterin converting factor small subunit [Desulforadius tongensis]